jgi:hypothetical protein
VLKKLYTCLREAPPAKVLCTAGRRSGEGRAEPFSVLLRMVSKNVTEATVGDIECYS